MFKNKTEIFVEGTDEAVEKAYADMNSIGVKVEKNFTIDRVNRCCILAARMSKTEQNKIRNIGYIC